VIDPGSTLVGNATLVVANVLTCNKHSPNIEMLASVHKTPPYHQLCMAVEQTGWLHEPAALSFTVAPLTVLLPPPPSTPSLFVSINPLSRRAGVPCAVCWLCQHPPLKCSASHPPAGLQQQQQTWQLSTTQAAAAAAAGSAQGHSLGAACLALWSSRLLGVVVRGLCQSGCVRPGKLSGSGLNG
jgi:hypothetical protein